MPSTPVRGWTGLSEATATRFSVLRTTKCDMEISLSKTVLNNSNNSSNSDNSDNVINLTNGYKILMIMWLLRIVVSVFIIITLLGSRVAE